MSENKTPPPVTHAQVTSMDLSTLLRDAFMAGAGVPKNTRIPFDVMKRWVDYDPTGNAAYTRLAAALSPSPQPNLRGDPKPFMYGIMCPDGTAYLDEICVDSNDSQTLIDVIEEQELEGHKVVPLYVHPPSPAQYLEEEYDADIALFDKAIASAEARLCITNADLPLIINALGYAERSNVRGAGELRDKLKARLEGC